MKFTKCSIVIIVLFTFLSAYVSRIADLITVKYDSLTSEHEEGGGSLLSGPPYPDDTLGHTIWFLQISDLHLSKFADSKRVQQLREFCNRVVKTIKPSLVLATGDLTDAKTGDLHGSQQYIEEWKTYNQLLIETEVQKETIWLDIRGNHDNFNVPSIKSSENYYRHYSIQGKLHARSYMFNFQHDNDTYSFIGVDACLEPGPKRPFNFIGLINEEEMKLLKEFKTKSESSNVTFWFGHYPTSSILSPSPGIRNLMKGSYAYFCGHFHTLGGLVKKMYTIHHSGSLELELADWKDSRMFRIAVLDHGLFTFVDLPHDQWPVVVITNPKHALYSIPTVEPLQRILQSTHIRVLVFSTSAIAEVKIKINDGKWQSAFQSRGPLYIISWVPSMYATGVHTIYVQAKDVDDRVQEINQPFTLDGSQLSFQILSRLVLMTSMIKVFQVTFGLFMVIAVVPLCVLRIVHKLVLERKIQKPRFQCRCFQALVRKLWLLVAIDRLFYPLMFCILYVPIGPWFIGEIIEDHIGWCFAWGMFLGKSFLPGGITFAFGVVHILTFHIPLTLFLAHSVDCRYKQMYCRLKVSFASYLCQQIPFLILLTWNLWIAYSFLLAYGTLAFVLGPLKTWTLVVCLYLWHQVASLPEDCFDKIQLVFPTKRDEDNEEHIPLSVSLVYLGLFTMNCVNVVIKNKTSEPVNLSVNLGVKFTFTDLRKATEKMQHDSNKLLTEIIDIEKSTSGIQSGKGDEDESITDDDEKPVMILDYDWLVFVCNELWVAILVAALSMATTCPLSHYVFQNNPTELRKFLYKQVVVDVCNEKQETGWVYTIDPVSGSVILVNFINNRPKDYTIVLGHSVKNISIINDNIDQYKSELDKLCGNQEKLVQTTGELEARKDKIKNWFNKNRIPFEEKSNGDLSIMDALTLSSPYLHTNCTSANTIVLGKVQGLIKGMPPEVEDCGAAVRHHSAAIGRRTVREKRYRPQRARLNRVVNQLRVPWIMAQRLGRRALARCVYIGLMLCLLNVCLLREKRDRRLSDLSQNELRFKSRQILNTEQDEPTFFQPNETILDEVETTTDEETTTTFDDEDVTSPIAEENEKGVLVARRRKIHEHWSENNATCIPAAYHEFPHDLFTNVQRQRGAVIIHVLVCVYMFYALAVVCDGYFVTSLERICEKMGLSEDVAGATFMAAGSSAPELFASILGVFVAKADVGTGTIIGSAVFNILFVIGICAIFSRQTCPLSWWPLIRDTAFYAITVLLLMAVMADGKIYWWESVIMLLLYAVYIVLMKFNVHLRSWLVEHTFLRGMENYIQSSRGIMDQNLTSDMQGPYVQFNNDMNQDLGQYQTLSVPADESIRDTRRRMTFFEATFRIMMTRNFRPKTRFWSAAKRIIEEIRRVKSQAITLQPWNNDTNKDFDQKDSMIDIDNWNRIPSLSEGVYTIVVWGITLPVQAILYYSIPNCHKQRWEKWYLLTFCNSMLWIAFFSYILVWMVTLVGFTCGIPDSVMGITFLAAGTSVPDALSSLIVARQGQADMAVSNSIGSNVFDILIGLALPWFLQTTIVMPGTGVYINSEGMWYNVVLLFLSIALMLMVIHFRQWQLSPQLGKNLLALYCLFLLLSILTEYNLLFGNVNPPECEEPVTG
uniref:AD domain-containing protein n=1 Tax=Strigamia maritima TaxID=126957 RepID=T1IQP5_STRMM